MKIPAQICLIISLCTIFSGCIIFNKRYYTDPVKCYAKACIKQPYDVIIVPGYPADSGHISDILAERMKWAFFLYKNGFAKHIIFSGSAVYSPYTEAKAMRQYALSLGIKPEDIFVETKAEHTVENLYYSYLMAGELGFNKIAFATQPVQTSAMIQVCRKYKFKIDMLPIVSDSVKNYSFRLDTVNISEAFKPGFVSIKDRQGLIKRLQGTRGKRVKKEIRKAKKLKKTNAS